MNPHKGISVNSQQVLAILLLLYTIGEKVCVFVCVCVCARTHVHVYVCLCGDMYIVHVAVRDWHLTSCSVTPHLIFKTRSLTEPGAYGP